MTYRKHLTADSYRMVLVYDDGREQEVSNDQDLLLQWLAAGNVPEEVPYVAPPPATPIPTPAVYSKLAIRRAMRALGTEAQLDALLDASPMFRADWTDATEIDLADPVLAQALAGAEIDVDAVKGAIG